MHRSERNVEAAKAASAPFARAPLRNGARADAGLPRRLKLLNWGANPSLKGLVRVGGHTLRELPRRQAETGFGEVAIDFEHNTVPGSPEHSRTQEPRRVAGYGVPRVIAGDGLYLEDLRWTPAGEAEALNFADLSPAVSMSPEGEVDFLHSVALTRHGAVHGLTFHSVTAAGDGPPTNATPPSGAGSTVRFVPHPTPKPTPPMNDTHTPAPPAAGGADLITVADLATALGLPETAAKADVLGRLTRAMPDTVPAAPELTALSARLDRVENELAQREAAALAAEKAGLIQRFAAEGKVPLASDGTPYSAEQLTALEVGTLKLLHANTPSTVPLSRRNYRPHERPEGSELKGLDRVIAAFKAGSRSLAR